ncbi:MAG: dipeptidase [Bacteroidales bacterium]|nr:dipeptidase [Bacteroidales bacterium]
MIYDSHMDTPSQLIRLRNLGIDNPHAHVDFPKLRAGGVDGAFFALYTPAEMPADSATRYALEMLSAVYDAADANPDYAAVTFSPEEAAQNREKGIISLFMGMENGAPIQESLSLLRTFYRLGVSYITLTHNGDNAIADSAAEGKRWGGLSPFGREVVKEMNALGMIIDLSHASDQTFWDCIRLSEAPIVATHSCCRTLCSHRRNLTDEMLQALGEKGGYVGINYYPAFLSDEFATRPGEAALLDEAEAVEAEFIREPSNPAKVNAWNRMQERLITEIHRPGVKEIADHIDHAVRLAGINHVGIGSDFDGILVPPAGLEDVSKTPVLVEELSRRGYTESQINLLMGGNLMAVWKRVIKCSE